MVFRSQREIPPGRRIRVLIVDDSVVARKLASRLIEKAMGMEVAATAANGQMALARMAECAPDVVTLDLNMPDMDGLETLRAIRRDYPEVRVIMFSSSTRRGAAATLEALALGADDYATKAGEPPDGGAAGGSFCADLIPKIRQFFKFHSEPEISAAASVPAPAPVETPRRFAAAHEPAPAPRTAAASPPLRLPAPARKIERQAVVIGVSTGGPTALADLMPQIPETFPLPILIVQHMPPTFTTRLAERLQGLTKLRVREAANDDIVERGQVYVAPGDYHMRVVRKKAAVRIALDQGPLENSCRPAADVLFRSAAEVWGGAVIAVILTGMGQDGLKGTEVLHDAGAYVIAQDEASSVVWGMPGAVAQAGLAHLVAPLGSIPTEIQMLVRKA